MMESTQDGLVSNTESSGFFVIDQTSHEFLEANSRYQLLEEIGRGGMGIVYRARDLTLHRDVAVKILLGEYLGSCRAANQFVNEARIMGVLQHPGIAHVYECGTTSNGRPFHAMKLVQGKTLEELLDERVDIEQITAQMLSVFSVVCQAMAYAHSEGLVHLDLKPDNIMVGEFGEVHVMDWGLAKALKPSNGAISVLADIELTSPQGNGVHGTIQYMAPEQARGEPVDKRTDVFCLGAILCKILTGAPPCDVTVRKQAMKFAKAANLQPAFERLDACGSDSALVRLAKQCLSPNPDSRPSDAGELDRELVTYKQSALQLVRNDMTRFFELSLDLFCIAGFDGYFRRINSNFSRVLGFTDEELLAKPFLSFVHPEDQAKTVEVMGKLFDGLPVVRFRNRYLTKDNKTIEFEWTAKSMINENVIFAVARNVS